MFVRVSVVVGALVSMPLFANSLSHSIGLSTLPLVVASPPKVIDEGIVEITKAEFKAAEEKRLKENDVFGEKVAKDKVLRDEVEKGWELLLKSKNRREQHELDCVAHRTVRSELGNSDEYFRFKALVEIAPNVTATKQGSGVTFLKSSGVFPDNFRFLDRTLKAEEVKGVGHTAKALVFTEPGPGVPPRMILSARGAGNDRSFFFFSRTAKPADPENKLVKSETDLAIHCL